MTNLSELLPSGGGAKEFDAIASGTLPSGQTVILKSDGKVEAVGITSQAIGSTQNWSGTDQVNQPLTGVYDDVQQRVIIAFTETSPSYYYGQLIAGEVDAANNSITFGTASIYNTTFGLGHTLGYDSVNNKAVVFFQDVSQSSYGKARVASISGSTITFPGSNATYNSGSTEGTNVAFSPTLGSFLVVFKDNGNSAQPGGVVGTVSGNNISFGSETTLDNKNCSYLAPVWDSTYSKYLMFYSNDTNTQFRYQYITVSGTTVTAGSPSLITLNSSTSVQAFYTSAAYDSVNQKIYLATTNGQNSSYASALVATSDGTTLTFGTENFFAGNTTNYGLSLVWDSSAEKVVISYLDTSQHGKIISGSVSGTTLTFGSAESFRNAITGNLGSCYDSDAKRVITAYTNQVSGDYTGHSVVFQPESSNASNFIGITSEAIANTATGKVNPQGGVATSSTITSVETYGSSQTYESAESQFNAATYDSNSNRVVVAYSDQGDGGKGYAAVGTVSGNSISFGTPVQFFPTEVKYCAITFDPDTNQVVICFADDQFGDGRGIVGSVDPSDNSITFGSSADFTSNVVLFVGVTYDTNTDKIVCCYRDFGNSNNLTSAVGTVSGTSITFETPVVANTGNNGPNAIVFDSSNNKVVILTNEGQGKGFVGTVLGSSPWISFGTDGTFGGGNPSAEISAAFDTTNNKVVVSFQDQGDNRGKCAIGTVSGSSITFGSLVEFNGSSVTNGTTTTFDSNLSKIIVAWTDQSNSYAGTAISGTVSGTSITFGTSSTWATRGDQLGSTFDPTTNQAVIVYRDVPNSEYGTAIVAATAGATANFVTGSTYYVQNDGTITTTSSSVPAGRAISTTQLILNGAS